MQLEDHIDIVWKNHSSLVFTEQQIDCGIYTTARDLFYEKVLASVEGIACFVSDKLLKNSFWNTYLYWPHFLKQSSIEYHIV